jgi:hypothetical protein
VSLRTSAPTCLETGQVNQRRTISCLEVAQRKRVADGDTNEGGDSAREARRYPAGVSAGATTICTRDVVLSRISFTGW